MQSIKKNGEFRHIYSHGKSYADKNLVLYFIQNSLTESRWGVSVSKKVGKAVVRNKTKRRIKELLRLNENNIKAGYDLIFVVRVKCAEASYSEISASVKFLLLKFRLLTDAGLWTDRP